MVECGFRCHLTNYARTTATQPSAFVERLRKALKTRRVSSVRQIGTDRIIEIQFSDGQYRLFLEFYAAGNIVLTDTDLKVLALFRAVNEGAEHERLRVGLQYDLSLRQNYTGVPPLTKDRVREGLRKAIEKQKANVPASAKSKKQEKDNLRKALSTSITEYPPFLVDHAFRVVDFDSTLKPEEVLEAEELLDKLMLALEEAKHVVHEITSAETVKGYILAKAKVPPAATDPSSDAASESTFLYDDFHPFKPKQFESKSDLKFLEFDGFNKTVDEFYSSLEGQKLENRLQEREATAKRRLDQARADHAKRLGGLQDAQQLNVRKAEAILSNVERVREAMAAVTGLIEKGMDWVEIARLIEREQTQGNQVAQTIKLPLKLYENTITVLLAEESFDDEEDEADETSSDDSSDSEDGSVTAKKKKKKPSKPEDKRLVIDIDLGLSPWANASQYHNQKKTAAVKEEKTVQAMEKALKSTERKVAADLKKGLQQEKDVLRPVRNPFWFEKFTYFLSSDGYLVLGGKDVQQQEILYSRHFKKGDVYVHADLQGAVPLVIKNNPATPDAPIPPSTLSQAGNLSVSTSSAWDSKAIMSAWWVKFDQVSKTGHGGEYLAPGVFVVNGTKNFLPPAQLLLGFGTIFQISEESKAKHKKYRFVEEPPADSSTEAIGNEGEVEDKNDEGKDDDSDEDFPDAKLEEDDEDFPDAKLDSGTEEAGAAGEDMNGSQSEEEVEDDEARSHQEPLEAEDNSTEAQEDDDDTAATAAKSSKRHLSAKERRDLRKGQSNQRPGSDLEDASINNSKTNTGVNTPSSVSGVKGALPRGKRGKAKKAAAKYADQDEEERALAMRLLGVQPAHQKAVTEALVSQSKEEDAQAQKQRRREQHLRAQAIGKAAEEARRAAADGSNGANEAEPDADEERERMDSLPLDCFIGRPLPGDELITAIPVCAPWSALSNYKYKVKLQPGSVKKGKAVKEILGRWEVEAKDPKRVDKKSEDGEKLWPKEVELIRSWKEAEVFGIVPVRTMRVVQSAGASGGGKGGGVGGGGGGKGKGKQAARGGKGSKKK